MLPNSLNIIAEMVEKETGIVFSGTNLYQLKTRLEELAKKLEYPSVDELSLKIVQGDPVLKNKLFETATNNETLFFRDPAFFQALENFVVQEILPHNPPEIKIWSAASSTGQEALSVAMTLDNLNKKTKLPPFSIIATDIAERAVTKAKSGVYSDFEVMRGLSEAYKQSYFKKESDGWHVRSEISSKVKFGFNNLIKSNVQGPFHIILCRNVLIYQRIEMKKVVIDSLMRELGPQGGIMLGVGETLLGIAENVGTTILGSVIIYRKGSAGAQKAS
jgi:chemotaxis protein methyltransferase CheR